MTLRAVNIDGRRAREHEFKAHIETALAFREETRRWQASSREVRLKIEEQRRTQAHLAREQKERDKETVGRFALRVMWERKVAHDHVCVSRLADESLVADYHEHMESRSAPANEHTEARMAALRRATARRLAHLHWRGLHI